MNGVRLDQLEHAGEEQTLELETAFVVGIGENEEDILNNTCEISLEEAIADVWVSAREVINDLQAYWACSD